MSRGVGPTERAAADPSGWVERHGDYLYRFAVAAVRHREAAEDLVQEALLAAWRARGGFAGDASERTWLTAILKRKVTDWLRRRVVERDFAAEPDAFADGLFDRRGHWKRRPAAWGDLGDPVARDEFRSALAGCLGRLPERLHAAFALRYLDERPGGEVCTELGLTPANLWVMLHRARLRLAACLTRTWLGGEPS